MADFPDRPVWGTMFHMRRLAAVAIVLGLWLGIAPTAEAGYRTFHPKPNVTAKQIAPKKIKFVNRTPLCVALRVTQKKNGYRYTATYRLWYTHETDKLLVRGKVVRVSVYKPGC